MKLDIIFTVIFGFILFVTVYGIGFDSGHKQGFADGRLYEIENQGKPK